MRLCFFVPSINENAGIGRVSRMMIRALSDRHEITVISLRSDGDAADRLPDGIKTQYLYDEPRSLSSVFGQVVGAVKAHIKAEKTDVIVAASEMLAPVCAVATAFSTTKYIAWVHTNADVSGEFKFQTLFRGVTVRTAALTVTLNDTMAENYRRKYRSKRIRSIPNPVDPVLIRPIGYKPDSKRIISVGRLGTQKNFGVLIDVAERVLPLRPEWSWDIYGDGPMKNELQSKIDACGLGGRLTLCGSVSDLYDRYGDYAFQVMTSLYEGYPMTLLEGMACGLPLVSFDIVSGPSLLIDNGENGFLIPPYDILAMSDAVLRLTDSRELRMQMSKANEEKRHLYSIDTAIGMWESLFESL